MSFNRTLVISIVFLFTIDLRAAEFRRILDFDQPTNGIAAAEFSANVPSGFTISQVLEKMLITKAQGIAAGTRAELTSRFILLPRYEITVEINWLSGTSSKAGIRISQEDPNHWIELLFVSSGFVDVRSFEGAHLNPLLPSLLKDGKRTIRATAVPGDMVLWRWARRGPVFEWSPTTLANFSRPVYVQLFLEVPAGEVEGASVSFDDLNIRAPDGILMPPSGLTLKRIDGATQLSFLTQVGHTYQAERAPQISMEGRFDWQPFGSPVDGSGTNMIVDTELGDSFFYRVGTLY